MKTLSRLSLWAGLLILTALVKPCLGADVLPDGWWLQDSPEKVLANPITLRQPYMDPALCIGCGICEHECPVTDEAAIRVTAVGETRSKERRLLMDGGVTSAVSDLEKRQR